MVNKHHCNLFTMYSFLNNLFTVTVNNNTTYIVDLKVGLVTEIIIPNYQSSFFKLTQLAKMSQKNIGKPQLFIVTRLSTCILTQKIISLEYNNFQYR